MNIRGFRLMVILIGLISVNNTYSYAQSSFKRRIISLKGTWQIAEGGMDTVPKNFTHKVRVPGLVSLAEPAFENVGPRVKNRRNLKQSDPLRKAFWYRRSFTIKKPIPAVAMLKINKAKYGIKIFLNKKEVGEHLPCFTPGYFNIKKALKTGKNELIVRIGASRDAVPPSVPDGFDQEKERYIPGIYDNVQVILSGEPHIVRIQTVPDIVHKELQVQLTLSSAEAKTSDIAFMIKELKSQKTAGSLAETVKLKGSDNESVVNVRIPVKNCHLWSPETPFLYNLIVKTEGDEKKIEFGMREFHFDPLTKNAVLNGKPYFMRGSNITLFRFFEDTACKSLPWDTTWVRNLFKSFKRFHWNSLRFSICTPPEEWYRIADEEGFLIQNEFPIWYGGQGRIWPEELKTPELVKEYTEWMEADWNHPSIVIWDASNETVAGKTDETGQAVWQVRNLDLSNRPWDNSQSKHRAPGDVYESHPYHFMNPDFKLKDLATADIIPQSNVMKNLGDFPVIINEYGWLWLNRDGSPTTLTKRLYKNLLGPNSTAAQRWRLYAAYMAAETEFWRCHRQAAGVLIFSVLAYSRRDGQTSDFFIDPEKLKYDSAVLKYLPDAFSPIGLMLNEWGNPIPTGEIHNFNILAINDLGKEWHGRVQLKISKGGRTVITKSVELAIQPYGKTSVIIPCTSPKDKGTYTVEAVLEKNRSGYVKSIREIPFQ